MHRTLFAFGLLVALVPARGSAAGLSPALEQAVATVCDKRVALLGELPSHGEARGFAGKAAVAKALVERCGYDAVLFEAPMYEFVALEPSFAKHEATAAQLDDAIGKFWWAAEVKDWRAWLLREANAGRLHVGGIDDQVSNTSTLTRERLPALVARYLPEEDRAACLATVQRQLDWSYDDKQDFDAAEKGRLGRCVGNAASSAAGAAGDDGHLLANFDSLVSRTIEAPGAIDRDAAMPRNVLWQLQRLPPGAKVVVWTANVHSAKRSGGLAAKPMGAWLAESLGDALGSVAFTALDGSSSMAGHKTVVLPALAPGSLESKALATGSDEAFVAAPALRDLGTIQSRLFGKPAENEWATRFDGVVVYRSETPATFQAR
jgi:erythromycin esterase-like protein